MGLAVAGERGGGGGALPLTALLKWLSCSNVQADRQCPPAIRLTTLVDTDDPPACLLFWYPAEGLAACHPRPPYRPQPCLVT